MGFQGQQEILVRLMTEPGSREQFLADPRHTAESNGWPVSLSDDLATIPPERASKPWRDPDQEAMRRGDEVPAAVRTCPWPRGFGALFRIHASAWWPRGPKRHRDDAIAFAGVILVRRLLRDRPAVGRRPGGVRGGSALHALPNRRWGWDVRRP